VRPASAIIGKAATDKMRVAIVSDIHGNRRALEAVVAELRQIAPRVVCPWRDLAAGGASPGGDHRSSPLSRRGPECAGIRMRCFGRRNVWLICLHKPEDAPILPWSKRRFIRRLLASVKNACDGWKDFLLCTRSPALVWFMPAPTTCGGPLGQCQRRRINRVPTASLRAPIVVYGHIHFRTFAGFTL